MNTKAFFGAQGLSSTRANQVAELADRYADESKSIISSVQFYSEQMRIVGEEPILVENGSTTNYFAKALASIDEVADCYSLIAFLREAIKEKERLANEAKQWVNKEAREVLDAERRDIEARRRALVEPIREAPMTEDDVKATWSIGELNKFLTLQATCSVIGKFIHKDGALDVARKDLMERMKHPRIIKGEGRDITVTEFIPSVEPEDVEKIFKDLQKRWRDAQGELNGMKKKIEETIERDRQEKNDRYALALSEYNDAKRSFNAEIMALNDKERLIAESETKHRVLLSDEVRDLKIVIPKKLEEIFYAVMA